MRLEQAGRAFTYPFRPGSLRAWLPGMLLVVVLPLGLVPLLGYTVRAVRDSARDPEAGPPSMRLDLRLLRDGLLVLAAVVLVALPFAAASPEAYTAIRASGVIPPTGGPFLDTSLAVTATGFLLLLPWSLVVLLLAPVNLAAFAITGRARDLFDPIAAGRRVRQAFIAWNLATIVMVSAWAVAGLGALLCVGFIPASVYAMLVTAHAVAILAPEAGAAR